jgi:hypothetical protein
MPNDEPGLPRNAYASEGFSMVGFLWKPVAAFTRSPNVEKVGIVLQRNNGRRVLYAVAPKKVALVLQGGGAHSSGKRAPLS